MAKRRGDVFVVDDDEGFRAFLEDAFQQAGYVTSSFETAEEARRAIDRRRPDVLISDVRLPGVSGYELCHEIKDAYGDEVAVLLVSGDRTEPFDRAAGILLGADDYLVKPIDAGELVARVWRLTGRPNGRQRTKQRAHSDDKLATLSARENEVLTLLADGSSQNEIAEALFISPKTVATHVQRILTKLEVRNRTQAVAMALRSERVVARDDATSETAARSAPRRSRARASTRAH